MLLVSCKREDQRLRAVSPCRHSLTSGEPPGSNGSPPAVTATAVPCAPGGQTRPTPALNHTRLNTRSSLNPLRSEPQPKAP